MKTHNQKWYNLWKNQQSPLSREVDPGYRKKFAEEMKILLGDISDKRVLEFGCGDGLMFESYGFDKTEYLGVDFSDKLLEKFQLDYPKVTLKKSSAENFQSTQTFDLIFSSGMIQYLTPADLDQHFANMKLMLAKGGRIILGSILWKPAKASYYRCETNKIKRSYVEFIKVYLYHSFIKNSMGYWYEMRLFKKLAEKYGFDYEFYGSLHYPYRFHLILK